MLESLTRQAEADGGQETELTRSLLPPDVERVKGDRGRRRPLVLPRDVFHSFLAYCVSQLLHNFFGLGVFVGDESASADVLGSETGRFCLLRPPGSLTCFCFVVTE